MRIDIWKENKMSYTPSFRPAFGVGVNETKTTFEDGSKGWEITGLSTNFAGETLSIGGPAAAELGPQIRKLASDESLSVEDRILTAQRIMADAGATAFKPKGLDTI